MGGDQTKTPVRRVHHTPSNLDMFSDDTHDAAKGKPKMKPSAQRRKAIAERREKQQQVSASGKNFSLRS